MVWLFREEVEMDNLVIDLKEGEVLPDDVKVTPDMIDEFTDNRGEEG